jgi:hypothetical protein
MTQNKDAIKDGAKTNAIKQIYVNQNSVFHNQVCD